jgi:MFS family permease
VLCLAVSAVIAPTLRAAQEEKAPEKQPIVRTTTNTRTLVVLLGVIAGCTAFGEGALSDWGALHLRENLHASAGVAAAGYAAFSLAMAIGRLQGGRWIIRFGDTPVLLAGTVVAAAGMLAALFVPVLPVALLGFVAVGLGLANVFPLAIGRAGLIGGARGIALASMVGYTGLLGGPPLIGVVAGALGLPEALTSVSVLCLIAGGLAVAVGVELPSAASVAATLRGQATQRTRRHATDLLLLMEGTR